MTGEASGRVITSLGNPAVKAARALHLRKTHEETGLFLAEGLKVVTEAVELGHRPCSLLFGRDARDHPLLRRAADVSNESLEVTPAILAKISRRDNPQLVLAVFEQRFTGLDHLDPRSAACWIALDGVRDPGNLGTIVRTADAAGCGGVILIGDCCDPYSVEAVRASMGSIFAVAVAKTSADTFLTWRRRWPGAVVGTLLSDAADFRGCPYGAPTLLLMGSEQSGLAPSLAAVCDLKAKIPMRGRADSLNLAVATGIMVYAITAPSPAC
ncbi:MAG: RNA methyltransferase [Caulobacteraceae bacterium]